MSTWEYRVIEFADPETDTPWRAIHEVYRDDRGRLNGYAENPAVILWDAIDALADGHLGMDGGREIMKRMMLALEKPALVETDFTTTREALGDTAREGE